MILNYAFHLFAAQAAGVAPVYPPGYDPRLEMYLVGEQQFAVRLGHVLQDDTSRAFARYVEHEREKAVDRAEGDDDEDNVVQSFDMYMDDIHRKRRNIGIGMFGAGFPFLAIGLYTGLTLGEGSDGALAIAGFGGGVIVAGAVVWGVLGARLTRYRRARDVASGRVQARVRWRGLAPMYEARGRVHGVSVGFAF